MELQVFIAAEVGQVFIADEGVGVAVFKAGEDVGAEVILQT